MTSYRFAKRPKASRARVFNTIAPVLATGFGFVAFAMMIPAGVSGLKAKPEARIFTQGLAIQIDRSSPAFAALEDTLSSGMQSSAEIAETRRIELAPAKSLVSGIRDIPPVAEKIVREVRREESLLSQEREQRLANSRALIAALAQALPAITTSKANLVAAPSSVSTGSMRSSSDVAEAIPSDLPAGATVISAGQVVKDASSSNKVVTTISRADLAKLFAPLMQTPSRTPAFPSIASRTFASASDVRIAGLAPAAPNKVKQEDVTVPAENPNKDIHQLVIAGPVTFSGGIAITSSNDRVVIFRENDEEHLEDAQVTLRDATYEVFVDQPIGRLIGELRAVSGEVLGRGYFDLARLPRIESNKYRLEHIAMTIAPIPHGMSGTVATAPIASEANPAAKVLPVKNAHVQISQLPFDTLSKKDGGYKEDSLVEGSVVVTHADRPGHWGSIAYGIAGQPNELPMFTDSTIRAVMKAATNSDHESERTAVIWGRVTRGGRPVQGAHVDLMTGEGKPVYFNSMNLPDSSLAATSANGLYAFFPVEPGAQAVQATDGHGLTEPAMVPTEEQSTTQVNLELAISKNAKVRVYDAFKTDWPLSAEVRMPGRKHGAVVPKSGETLVTYTGGNNLLFLDADAGASYDRVRVVATRSQRKIEVPMIQTEWMSRLKGQIRANDISRTGTIVGFIRGAPAYQVSLESGSLGANTRVIYFDKNGDVTNQTYGIAGGGFVILNVPQGFRTILVQPSSTTKAYAQSVLVESSVTNVINKIF